VTCRFCGDDVVPGDLLHLATCDGRQGTVEAREPPLLVSGLSIDTWQTSAAAARSATPTDRAIQRERVYQAIAAAGSDGRTDDEVQLQLGLHGHSECPRRIELWKADRITERRAADGRTVRRRTRTGRSAVVWIARSA
jgi:hypothetical protein